MTLKGNVFLRKIMQATGGATPLMYACQQCRESDVLDILAKQPYKVKDRDRTLKTPLHYCAENSNSSCAEAVLKIAPELVNAQDENGYCTLHLAVIAGNKPLVKLLILKDADINMCDNEGHSAVHWAIVSSEKEALEMIIRAGANPSTPDIHGGYPLHYAVQICGSNSDYVVNAADTIKVVETLLHFGVDVNVKDKDGRQPILWAASAGSADAIIHLITAGACVEAADKDGLTALHCAASRGHTTTLETLITLCGAHVDVIDGNGCSALFYAVTLGHADATELLLNLGAEPNRQDRKGRTPAHCGAAKGQLETLRILQKHGGNLWLRNVKGDFPLHEAVASGRKDLVLWLLSQNPEAVNVANNDGRCLIHIASMYNNTEMVKVLLDAKSLVNPVMRTSKGVLMTPLNVALSKGHRSCGKFLQLHGGVPFSKVSKVETPAVYAVRISPSDEMMNKSGEASIRTITPSPDKGSSNRTSAEFQVIKTQSADKKKVYRRRKKRKTTLNVEKDSDTDTDDSHYDGKLRAIESRRSGKSSQYSEEENYQIASPTTDKHAETVKRKKTMKDSEKLAVDSSMSRKELAKEEIIDKKVADRKMDARLQRNKSFSETKNVSDLSPEDFPPLMQTVEQLDAVIMEETDFNKKMGEVSYDKAEVIDKSDGLQGNVKFLEDSHSEKKMKKESNGINIKKEENVEETSKVNQDPINGGSETAGKESPKESKANGKSPRPVAAKRSIGISKKDDKSTKSSASKSSADDVKKKEKPGSKNSKDGSSQKKGETAAKPGTASSSDGILEGNEKSKKSQSPVSKAAVSDKKDNKTTIRSEVKDVAEASQENENRKSPDKETENGDFNLAPSPDTDVIVVENEKEEEKNVADAVENTEKQIPESDTVVAVETLTKSVEIGKAEVLIQLHPPTPIPDSSVGESAPQENEIPVDEASTVQSNLLPPKEDKSKSTEEKISVKTTVENLKEESPSIKDEPQSDFAVDDTKKVAEDSNKIPEPALIRDEILTQAQKEILKAEEEIIKLVEGQDHEVAENSVTIKEIESDAVLLDESTTDFIITKEEVKAKEVAKKENDDKNWDNSPPTVEKGKEKGENPSTDLPANDGRSGGEDESVQKEVSDSKEDENKLEKPKVDSEAEILNSNAKTEDENVASDSSTADPPREHHLKENNEWMNSGKRHYRPPKVPRLCRRHRELQGDVNQISVTQLVQNTIRKYHMERGIFYQLLELKRLQIRAGRANEQVLVKRLADEYERSIAFIGMKHFSGLYKFREFEKFLYDQLKSLNSNHSLIIPEMKSYDDIDALSGILKKTRYKLVSEVAQPERFCTCITQRCHHSACAYTSLPCSTYISNFRRHKIHKPKKDCFLPRIDQSPSSKLERQKHEDQPPATLELIQGDEKRVISLPQTFPDKNKRYYVTFTIKSSPSFKEEGFFEDPKDYFKHRHAKSV